MSLYKFTVIAVLFAMVIIIVKNQSKDIGVIVGIACTIILISFILESMFGVLEEIKIIFESVNIDDELLSIIFKIIGVAYITEFGANICEESESKSLAGKIRLFGKITVLSCILPLISKFMTMIGAMI